MRLTGRLGKGSYGVVYKVEDPSGKRLALKRNFIDKSTDFSANLRELDILVRLQENDNIVKLEGVYSSPPFAFSPMRQPDYKDDYIYFLFPRASCDLHSLIYRRKGLGWEEKKGIIIDLLSGLGYLHSQNILHRDIKPSNILWIERKAVYCDFGISVINTLQEPLTSRVSISWYRSPEMFSLQTYGSKADVWALGCVFMELLTGRSLFNGTDAEVLESIDKLSREKIRALLSSTPPCYVEVVASMLEKSPNLRISAKQALQLLDEEREEFLPPSFPRLNLLSLPERLEANKLALSIYAEREDYYWVTPRILFQALTIFNRYLSYVFSNHPQGFKENGRYHSSRGVNLRFIACLYLSLKYFSSFSRVKSLFKLLPKFLQNYSKEEVCSLIEEFERFLVFNVCQREIYFPTPYEAADEFNYIIKKEELYSLLVYYTKVKGTYSSLEIFSSWWKRKLQFAQ